MTPEEIVTMFDAAQDAFASIIGQPADFDIDRLRKAFLALLLAIQYDQKDGVHDLSGSILPDPDYAKTHSGKTFPRPKRLPFYPAGLDKESSQAVIRKKEAEHKEERLDGDRFSTVERKMREWILDKVEDTWYRELEDATTFYTLVTPKQFLLHLQDNCTGLHALDTFQLQLEMADYHLNADGVFDYILKLEDAQKRAIRAKDDSVTDKRLVSIATRAMLTTAQFPRANEDWEALPKADKTWTEWKKVYKKAQKATGVNDLATGGTTQFGKANAATETGEKKAPPAQPPAGKGTPLTMEDLEGSLDGLAAAVTTGKDVMAELVASVDRLTTTNASLSTSLAKMHEENARLRGQLKSGGGGGGGGDKTRDKKKRAKGSGPRKCANCKRMVAHADEECWELPQNAHLRPDGWVSCL